MIIAIYNHDVNTIVAHEAEVTIVYRTLNTPYTYKAKSFKSRDHVSKAIKNKFGCGIMQAGDRKQEIKNFWPTKIIKILWFICSYPNLQN